MPAQETPLHADYGVTTPQVFLVRPDGHIAYIGAPEDREWLETYLDQIYGRHPPKRKPPTVKPKHGRPQETLGPSKPA